MEKLPDFDKAKEMLEKILKRRLDWVEKLAWLNKLSVSKPKKLVVYALEMNNGTVKIGVSKNLLQRMQSISYATGLKILRKYHTDFAPAEIARIIETSCHIKFEYGRVYGEYFNISFDEACNELASYQKKIETANEKSNEDYQKAVNRAWEIFKALEDNYFNRPTVSDNQSAIFVRKWLAHKRKHPARVNNQSAILDREWLAHERKRLALEFERLDMERKQITLDRERLDMERKRITLDRERLDVERKRLALEFEQVEMERRRMARERDNFAKAQLLQELAAASGDNQTLRNSFLREAAKLVTGKELSQEIHCIREV